MINTREIIETIRMIDDQHLDIRTITMGISTHWGLEGSRNIEAFTYQKKPILRVIERSSYTMRRNMPLYPQSQLAS